jgi:hypothetical protein
MHFDARLGRVEPCHMVPIAWVEVAVDQMVQVAQQVQIERCRHAQRIVVGGFQQVDWLDQINADQQAAAAGLLVHAVQKLLRGLRREVADARAWIEEHRPTLHRAARQIHGARKIKSEPQHLQLRMAAFDLGHRVCQKINRDVDRDIARGLQRRYQAHRFGAVARAQIDQRADRADGVGNGLRLR